MARMLNGDEEIDFQLIPQVPKEVMEEMDFMDVHVDIKKGLKYNNLTSNVDLAEEEYIRTHNLVKRSKLTLDSDMKGGNSEIQRFEWGQNFENDEYETVNDVLPYRTIDVIYNKKNIFVNLQNPNPASILFDIYNREKWYTVLKIRPPNETEPNQMGIWKQDIPAFYSFKNFLPYYSEEEIEIMKKTILSTLSNTVRNARLQKNLNTTLKSVRKIIINIEFLLIYFQKRELREYFDLYMIFLEMKDLGLVSKKEHKEKIEAWRKYVESKNNHITFSLLPLQFNYANETLISTFIDDNCSSFILKNKKDLYLVLSCKIFQYPNRVISVRIVIANCFKVGENDRAKEDDNIYQTQVGENIEDEDKADDAEDKKLLNKDKKEGDKKTKGGGKNPLIDEV